MQRLPQASPRTEPPRCLDGSGVCAALSHTLKHANGIPDPFETGLSEGKEIQATHIQIGPKADNVIPQLRCAARGNDLTARVTQKGQIVGSFFAPNRFFENQVLRRAVDFKRALMHLSWAFVRGPLPLGNFGFPRLSPAFGEGWAADSWLRLFEIDLGDGKVPMGFEDLEPLLLFALERRLIGIELFDEIRRIALHGAGCILENDGYAVIPTRWLGHVVARRNHIHRDDSPGSDLLLQERKMVLAK